MVASYNWYAGIQDYSLIHYSFMNWAMHILIGYLHGLMYIWEVRIMALLVLEIMLNFILILYHIGLCISMVFYLS